MCTGVGFEKPTNAEAVRVWLLVRDNFKDGDNQLAEALQNAAHMCDRQLRIKLTRLLGTVAGRSKSTPPRLDLLCTVFKVRRPRRALVKITDDKITPNEKPQKKRKRSRSSLSTRRDQAHNKDLTKYMRAKEVFVKPYRTRFDAHVEQMMQAEEGSVDSDSDMEKEKEKDKCIFCCFPLQTDISASLDCGHTFCLSCLEYWFATSGGNACPHGWCKKPATAIINSQGLRLAIASPPVRPSTRRKYHYTTTRKQLFVNTTRKKISTSVATSVAASKSRAQLPPREAILKLPCVQRHQSQVHK